MKKLDLPNPKSTKHRALYDAVNFLIRNYNNPVNFIPTRYGGASPSNKATTLTVSGACHDNRHSTCAFLECNCMCHNSYSGANPRPNKPHWESDYAAIWERYWNDDERGGDRIRLQQDILELIRRVAK